MASFQIILCSLVLATTSAQLAQFGVCELWTSGTSKCYPVSPGCPSGTIPHPTLAYAPWSCGGWYNVCCMTDATVTTQSTTTTTTGAPAPPSSPIDDTDCGLGVPSGRILQGSNTSKCDWPYVAGIRFRASADPLNPPLTQTNTQHACAAVIIDKYWVLTHALCCYFGNGRVDDVSTNFVVVAGEYDAGAVDDDPRYPGFQPLEQFVPVDKCVVNPGYANIETIANLDLSDNTLANGNGLALMKLAQPINNYCASTACLPNASPLTSATCDTFDQCVILGWGYEDQTYGQVDKKLKQGFVKIYKDDVCDFLQTNLFTAGPSRPENSACQSSDQGQDACLGDQGGPVLCYDGNRWAVQGIIPFNLCKDNEVNPYVVDVSYSDSWIYDTIRSNP